MKSKLVIFNIVLKAIKECENLGAAQKDSCVPLSSFFQNPTGNTINIGGNSVNFSLLTKREEQNPELNR